jgi:hypothetical protein
MNSRALGFVLPVMCALGGLGSGCVAVDGGSIELAWTVRTEDGRACECETPGVQTVSVCIQGCAMSDEVGTCQGETVCPLETFPCTRGRGSTGFSVAPGRTRIWITASRGDAGMSGITVPEALLRDITKGDVTELNALLISVPSTTPACHP